MQFRLRTWKMAFALSGLITAFSVVVSIAVVYVALEPTSPSSMFSALTMAGFIPLFIAGPISFFTMYQIKTIHSLLDTLDYVVRFDSLTGLITRTHFMSSAETLRSQGGYVGFIDADHFKRINDTLGHEAGDVALRKLSLVLMDIFGAYGHVGRLGGEEFGVRLPRVSKQQVELLAAAFGSRLRQEGFTHNGRTHQMTASLGFAAEDMHQTFGEVLKRADLCLYRAKREGRDRYIIDNPLDDKAINAA